MTILHTESEPFWDMTHDPFICEYPEIQFMGDHKFKHIAGGIYMADPSFELSDSEIDAVFNDYEVELFVEVLYDRMDRVRVLYAAAPRYEQLYNHYVMFRHSMNWHVGEGKRIPEQHLDALSKCAQMSSEDPSKEFRLKPKRRAFQWIPPEENDGTRIAIGHLIGDLIEPGIYYIYDPRTAYFDGQLFTGMSSKIRDLEYDEDGPVRPREISVIVDDEENVKYLATGRNYFPRLKELSELGAGRLVDDFFVAQTNPDIPKGAAEIYEGLGFAGIRFRYKIITDMKYIEPLADFAFFDRDRDELVLKYVLFGRDQEERIPIGLIEHLIVTESQELRSGKTIELFHEIIRPDEALKGMLIPAVYDLFQSHRSLVGGGQI